MRRLEFEDFIETGVPDAVAKTLVQKILEVVPKAIRDKAWKKAYRETHREQAKAYCETHREQAKAYCETHREQAKIDGKAYYGTHQDQKKAYSNTRNKALRLEVIQHYSGKCACCGETAIEFLQIDHIHGGGNKHRRDVVKGSIYGWLKNNGYPPEFRVLCSNCNSSMGSYGYCPHQGKVAASETKAE